MASCQADYVGCVNDCLPIFDYSLRGKLQWHGKPRYSDFCRQLVISGLIDRELTLRCCLSASLVFPTPFLPSLYLFTIHLMNVSRSNFVNYDPTRSH